VVPMGAQVIAEPLMTESLAEAKKDEKIEEEAKEMEAELGATADGMTDGGGAHEVPAPGEDIEEPLDSDLEGDKNGQE
jgi:hypothetical protein